MAHLALDHQIDTNWKYLCRRVPYLQDDVDVIEPVFGHTAVNDAVVTYEVVGVLPLLKK